MSNMNSYFCKCGREFVNKQAFNAHQAWCSKCHDERYLNNKKQKTSNAAYKVIAKNQDRRVSEYLENPSCCKNCGKPLPYELKNNKFCGRSCSATYNNLHRQHKSQSFDTNYMCPVCNNGFNSACALRAHIARAHEEYNMQLPYTVEDHENNTVVSLDITRKDMEAYKLTHTRCEICGKELEAIKQEPNHFRSLCVDHDHNTNHFRGLLCMTCNRNLGWYELRAEQVQNYLNKDRLS